MRETVDKQPRQLPHEEVVETWEDDKGGEYIQINETTNAVHYVTCDRAKEQICPPNQWSQSWLFRQIGVWMKQQQYWPNIWGVNDHGNVTLYSKSGRSLGGIV